MKLFPFFRIRQFSISYMYVGPYLLQEETRYYYYLDNLYISRSNHLNITNKNVLVYYLCKYFVFLKISNRITEFYPNNILYGKPCCNNRTFFPLTNFFSNMYIHLLNPKVIFHLEKTFNGRSSLVM